MTRISRDEMLFEIAATVAKRSTCDRKHIGAVIARDGRVLSIGYNGSPSRAAHCCDVGCLIDPKTGGCIRTQHAEANAIAWAAREGICTKGARLYATISPCLSCAKLIINAGIVSVQYLDLYRDTAPIDYLSDANIDCWHRTDLKDAAEPYAPEY